MCAKTNEKSGMTSKEVKQANKTLSTKDFAKKYSSYIGTSTNRISSASGEKATSTSSNSGIMSTSEFAKKYSQYRPTNVTTNYTKTTGTTNTKQTVTNSHSLKASATSTEPTNFLERFEQNYKTAQEVNNKGVDTGKRMGKGVRGAIQGEIGGVAGFTAKTALNNSGLSAEEMIDYNTEMPKDRFEQADEIRKQQTIDNTKAINEKQWKKRLTVANEFINKSNTTVEDAKENADAIQKFLVDVAKTGTEIAIDSAIGGVASIVNPTLGQYASNASMYVRASGTAYVDALNKGATESEAQTYGTMVGTVEVLTERLSGGLGKVYGKGLGENLSTRVVTNVMKKLGSKPNTIKAVVRLGQVIGEGNEEVVSDALNPILRSLTYGGTLKEEYAEEQLSDWLYDWLLGSFMGGLGSVVGANTNLNAEVDNFYNNNQNIAKALSQMETQDAPSNSVVKAIMQDKSALEELGIDTQNKHASEIKHDIRVAIDELYFNSKDNVETEINTETNVETNVDTNQVDTNRVNNVDTNVNNIQQDVGLNDDLSNDTVQQANDITEVENANVGNVENTETDVAEQTEPRIKTDEETKAEKVATIAKTYGDEVAKLFNEEDADVDAITSVDGQKIMRNGYEGRKFYPLKNIGISIKEQYRIYQAGIEFRKGKVEERVQQSLRIENRLVREKQITYRQLRAIKSFEKITNHKIIFEDMQRSTVGYTDAFGNIHLNSNIPATECYTQIIGHELYHLIFNSNKELGESFSKTLQTMLDDNVSKKLQNRLVAMGYASTQVTEEMSADAFGVVFSEAEILESFAYTNMPLFKRISAKVLDFIKDFNTKVNKLSNVYKQDYAEYINLLGEIKATVTDIIELDSAREVGIVKNEDGEITQKFKRIVLDDIKQINSIKNMSVEKADEVYNSQLKHYNLNDYGKWIRKEYPIYSLSQELRYIWSNDYKDIKNLASVKIIEETKETMLNNWDDFKSYISEQGNSEYFNGLNKQIFSSKISTEETFNKMHKYYFDIVNYLENLSLKTEGNLSEMAEAERFQEPSMKETYYLVRNTVDKMLKAYHSDEFKNAKTFKEKVDVISNVSPLSEIFVDTELSKTQMVYEEITEKMKSFASEDMIDDFINNVIYDIINDKNKVRNDRTIFKSLEIEKFKQLQDYVIAYAKTHTRYTEVVYHGTENHFGSTDFSGAWADDGQTVFCTNSKDVAQSYSGTYKTPPIVYSKLGVQDLSDVNSSIEDTQQNQGNYTMLADISDAVRIDANGSNWDNIRMFASKYKDEYETWFNKNSKKYYFTEDSNNSFANTRTVAQFLHDKYGTNCVIIEDVYDSGGVGELAEASDVYVFFNGAEQLKSADAITYDDNGNIIPLSKRFDSNDSDIRYKKTSTQKETIETPNDIIVNVGNMTKATKKYGHEKEINAFIGYLKALQKDKALAEKTVVNLKKRVGEETFNKIMQEYFNMPNETLAEVNKEVTNKKIKVQEEKIKKQAEEINKVNEQLQILSQAMGEENTAYAEMYIKYKELEKDIETKIKNNSQLVKENKSLKSAVKVKELKASSEKLGDAITKLRKTMSDNVLFNQSKEVTLDLMSEVLMNIQAQINGISSFKFDNNHLDIDKIETLINNLTAQGYVFQNEEIKRLFENVNKMNANDVAELTPKHIYEMAELVNSVAKQVSSRNKIIDGKGNLLDADLVADVIVDDYENIYVAKTSLKSMRFENLVSFITGYKKDNYLAKVLRDVQLSEWKQIKLVNDMNKFMGKFNQKKFKEHLQEEVEYEGVKMNRDLLISIYMHTFNEDNILHITNGGIYVPTTKDYYNPNKKNDAWNNKKALVIDGDIEKVQEDIESLLTKEDMEYVMMLKACISTMQKSVNRVSRTIQNADAWNINEYWAINVDKDIVGEGQEKLGSTISSVNTFGNRNHNSKKPILLHGTQDHISSLINIYSRYVGSGVEMHNLFTLLGLNIETEEFEETSITKTIRNKFGNDAIDQLTRNIADFEGKKRNTDTNMFGTIRSLAYSKALVLNAGVASKQAVSFISACSEIGYRDVFNKHLVNHSFLEGNSINKLINKYTGLLDYRTKGMGDFENDVSGIVKTPLMKINVNEKINESKYLNLITLVDYKTVQQLWYACENYVYRTTKLRPTSKAMSGTDAFYIRVAEVYNNVVTRTQPNYSTLERAEFIKSKDPVFMLTSMYKTQPAQNYNQAQYAINNYKAQLQYAKGEDGKVNKNDANLKDAKNYCARTLATLTAQSIMYTLLDTAINALRTNASSDDDDDKDYFYFAKMAFTVANSIIGGNAYGNIILVLSKAMLGIIDYTDEVGVNLFDPIDNMATKINKLTKSLIKGENEVENWQAVSRMFTDVFGYLLPTGEAKRIYKALEKYVEPFKESEFNKKVAPWIVHS